MTAPRVTNLQRRILQLIDGGARGIDPIADELGVHRNTVKRSVVSLGRKLQVPIPQMPDRARALGVRF